MIKVFLVEDEIIMREGIRNNIDWEKEGFEFVGEASDGELAYPLIQKTKPDILITDIQMPFMDGLELSRLVKQEMPKVKIIVLSGYDEFEYAHKGINIGITDYLLKPIDSAKLLEAVKKVGELVLEEQEFTKAFEQEHQEHFLHVRQNFFQELVWGKHSASNLLEKGREVGLELVANRYNILLFQIFLNGGAHEYSEQQNLIVSKMENTAGTMPEIIMIELGIEGWAFIFKEIGEKTLEEIQEAFIREIEGIMQSCEEIEYFGGMGKIVERISELNQCYQSASRAFASRYFKKHNQIVKYDEKINDTYNRDEPELASLEVKKLDRRIVERFLKTGLKSEVSSFLDEFFISLGEKNIRSYFFMQYVSMDIYIAAVSMLEDLGYKSDELVERCGDINNMAAAFSSAASNKEYLKNILDVTIDLREAVSQKKYHSFMDVAVDYIQQHFFDEDISLNKVAASVNLSPNHFSSIFSQEMGKTFVEYLTFVRMEKAKELLCTTSKKSSEIAYAVGYKDAHYFSYLFKKTQKCTPREFRQR